MIGDPGFAAAAAAEGCLLPLFGLAAALLLVGGALGCLAAWVLL